MNNRHRNKRALGCLLALVAVTILSGSTIWSVQAQQEAVTARQMAVVETFTNRAAVGTAFKVDGAGQQFVATLENNGFDAWIQVKRYSPSGQVTWQERFDPPDVAAPNSHKADSVTLTASGTTLVVGGTSHETGGSRPYYVVVGYAPGVYTPFPSEGVQEDGAGAYVFPSAPSAPTLTKEEIAQEVMRLLRQEFGGSSNNIRQGVYDKTKDAIRDSFDGGNGSHQVYNQLRNTSYSGSLDALRTYGSYTPTPTRTP